MSAKSKTTVHVVLDTNALFTEAADKLVAQDIGEFIVSSSKNIELDVHWYLPGIVRSERQYQMTLRALRLLPHLQKIEKLLGHHLGITEEVLQTRVEEAIKKQIDTHGLKEPPLDTTAIDWQRMIERSVFRRPPFDPGETEKGFRDAILLEVFCQLAQSLPKTPQLCRVVLLSDDELLVAAAKERLADRTNVSFVGELEGIKTMLNALASELTQEMVNSILPKARELFFKRDDQNSLYYKADIYRKIWDEFGEKLRLGPEADFIVSQKAITIGPPTFLTKSGQTLTFAHRIRFAMEATKLQVRPWTAPSWPPVPPSGTDPSPYGVQASTTPTDLASYLTSGGGSTYSTGIAFDPALGHSPSVEEIKREGEVVFEVTWSVTLTSKGTLMSGKFMKVNHASTTWSNQ